MATGTLYTFPENFRAYKALVAAQYSGFTLTVDPSFKFGESNKTEEFLQKFPLGKVPAFESIDGVCLNESNAIATFVANEALLGSNKADAARITQWMNFADSEIMPAACTWCFPCMGFMQFNKQNTERAKEEMKAALAVLDAALATRTFLVGERVTLADISVACNLLLPYQLVLEPAFRSSYVNANRWFETLVNQPQFKTVLTSFTMCEKMAQFDAKKYAETCGSNKKEAKPKAKKTATPKKAEKKVEKEPEEPQEDAPKPKPKDPFAAFPAGDKFVMDPWKKIYSNDDTETVALPWFFENFDSEHYSIWKGEYLYNDDLSLDFMSMNLVAGMFQRLDGIRKYAFGVCFLLSKGDAKSLSQLWITRGHQLPFSLSEDFNVDAPSYEWKKIEWGTEECKKLVTEYWLFEGDFEGRTYVDGKVYK